MVNFKTAFVASTCVAAAAAVDITVSKSGGNATYDSKHHYGYGFLHEVRIHSAFKHLQLIRLSTGHQQLR